MDLNDDQIDERKLTELDEEVSNYLEMENLNNKAKDNKNCIYNSYNNNNKQFNKHKEDLYYESKLETSPSINNNNNRYIYT